MRFEKQNEMTACPELLDMLKIKNALITTDAMMCQKTVCEKIIKKSCDCVLAVKNNHPTMLSKIEEFFFMEDSRIRQIFQTSGKGHGRKEKRICFLDTDISWFPEKERWKGLKAFGKCE